MLDEVAAFLARERAEQAYEQRVASEGALWEARRLAFDATADLCRDANPHARLVELADVAHGLARELPDHWMPDQCEREWAVLRKMITYITALAHSGRLLIPPARVNEAQLARLYQRHKANRESI